MICNKGNGRSERRRRFLLPLRVCSVCLWALLLRARWWPWGLCGCSGVWFPLLYYNKKSRIWPALREAITPQMLRALYAAVSLRFGKFLISDPGVSLFGIFPLTDSESDSDNACAFFKFPPSASSTVLFSDPTEEKATPLSTRAAFEALCSSCVMRYFYAEEDFFPMGNSLTGCSFR